MLIAAASLVVRFRRATGLARQRLRWLAVAAVPNAAAFEIHRTLRALSDDYPVQILAEYFGRNQIASGLFANAKEFNSLAFSWEFRPPTALTNGVKAAL